MSAVIRLRPQEFEPEELETTVEVVAPQRVETQNRWPIYLSVLVAVAVSVSLWAGLAWLAMTLI